MGWLYGWSNLKDLMRSRKEGYSHDGVSTEFIEEHGLEGEPEDFRFEAECLKACFRGNIRHSGSLWKVWEHRWVRIATGEAIRSFRFIAVDLLRCYNREWGYKDLDETMGPCEVNCPLSYLDIAPVPLDSNGKPYECAVEWRESVREYHARMKGPAGLGLMDKVVLRDGLTVGGEMTITSMKPLKGRTSGGIEYHLKRSQIKEIVEKHEPGIDKRNQQAVATNSHTVAV